jgi:2'-hydroxyisoflavone reductase
MTATRRHVVNAAVAAVGGAILPDSLASAEAAPPGKLRILILGGTGFIGPPQVRYALGRGHQVTIFNRGRHPESWPGPIEELIGDRNSGDLPALEGRDWDVCIDNPTSLPFWVRDAGHVLAGKVGQYVFVSTISVYAKNDKPADESDALARYEGPDAMAERNLGADYSLYGPLKAVCEQEAERRFPGRVTVVRPGLIVGPGDETDRFTYWPVHLARGGEVLAPGDGNDPTQVIDARDLSEWMIRLAEQRTFGIFNATGPARTLTMKAMLEEAATAVSPNRPPTLTWVPTAFLEARKVSAWSDLPAWIPGQGRTAGFMRRDIRRALGAGLAFRPLATTAADTLAWFRTLPAERQAKLRAGLSPEREAELLAAWKAGAKAG